MRETQPLLLTPAESGLTKCGRYWFMTKDADPAALAIYLRHYSRRNYSDGRQPKQFVGPVQKMVLLTADGDALFVWRKFISDDGQDGVNCAVFRNEGPIRASVLIEDAVAVAGTRWPTERLYTYVNPRKIRSTNPGYCFLQAGWRKCGTTKGGLIILETIPQFKG